MRLADYVADFLADLSPRVYGVCGAGAMYLNDAICNHPRIKFVAMHHEQAAAMAAEADARISGKIGIVHVTAGPGGTNAITGIAGAWVDSIPMLVIAGQVTTASMKGETGLRQLGTNELGMVEMVRSITKYAVTVTDPRTICSHLKWAVAAATSGRKGPVWIEIPLDVQSAEIDLATLHDVYHGIDLSAPQDSDVRNVVRMLNAASRPLIIAGNGIHLAGAEVEFRQFIDSAGIPVVTSWNGTDLLPSHHSLAIGRPGIMGDRAGNFAVQNADVILAIGTRLSVPQIGHTASKFAPGATLIVVDVDPLEARKLLVGNGISINADAGQFLRSMIPKARSIAKVGRFRYGAWRDRCFHWKNNYPVMLPEYREAKEGVNSYAFIEELGKQLNDDAIVVTDVGAAFISTMQSLQIRGTQRLFHSGGVSAMGYGIPAAIGACMVGGGRQTVCLVGDGGAMVNLQELQTIAHHKLPISIFVFVNGGYLTMQYTQRTHFDREAASSPKSGMSCASFRKLAGAFGLEYVSLWYPPITVGDMVSKTLLSASKFGPTIAEVEMPPNQLLQPRVQSKIVDGKFVPVPIHDMWPYLEREELEQQMAAGQ